MADLLLETKLVVPRARRELVARPRLTEVVDRAAHASLTLVSAPTGFGKTPLLTSVVNARTTREDGQRSVAWVSQRLIRLLHPPSGDSAFVRALDNAVPKATPSGPQPLVDPLSNRELDVLRLLASDLDGPGIARQLSVSLATVRTHTQHIYAKLGVSNRRAAVRRGHQLGV